VTGRCRMLKWMTHNLFIALASLGTAAAVANAPGGTVWSDIRRAWQL